MGHYQAELEVAVAAARAGGAAAMEHYGTTRSVAKADASPVTAADHAANDAILARLREAFPTDAFLSEEKRDDLARLEFGRVWVVDPLDGTKEFLARNGEFSIMIGLAVAGRAVMGVVFLPDPDVLYAAAAGGGAWVDRGGSRQRLVVDTADPEALRLVGSRSHPDPLLTRMQLALGITDVEPCGSVGVKCSRIADGRRDLYIHPVPYLKEWDTCAPEVVVVEAGGTVTDCRGAPLRYNKRDPRQPHGIVACGGGLGGDVLRVVSPIYEQARAGSGSSESGESDR
jgi:3'(2'), 5'-bisphosphate nucleotidase